MAGFRIGSNSEYLNVEIPSRAHVAQDYWDGNWVNADIEIAAGGFRGRFGAYLRAEELIDFRDAIAQLYSFSSREAKFKTMEGQLRINVKGDSLGHFTANCEALDQAGIGNRLNFTLSFDQTEIPAILKGLDDLVKEYPVVGNPDR